SRSKPVCADQNQIDPVWCGLSWSNQVKTALSQIKTVFTWSGVV
ncbi:hypothetical protein CP02DC18_1170, partial [Chlamydia psittaci 02DC18]